MTDYTVRLERVYQGPMDLLLHLVREQEVEIHEIEIHRVIEGFLEYVRRMEPLDLENAGDFLVMAATLMAIKSRSLLPHEEIDLEEELDPRDELIQRLIEYRRFKTASDRLGDRARERERIFDRGWRGEARELQEEPTLDLGDLTAWDLLAVWSRLLRETMADRPHRVATEARPMRYFVTRVVESVKARPRVTLDELLASYDEGSTRDTLIGSFCAVLELVKLELLCVRQSGAGGALELELREERRGDVDRVLAGIALGDEAERAEAGPTARADEGGAARDGDAAEPAGEEG